jgi:DNA repair protein RecO (recombination protein O)
MEKTRAILMKKHLLTETSLIISWCSLDHGLIKTVAKAARRPGSPFAGKLDLFYEADIAYAASKKSDLHTLRELEVIDYHVGLQTSYLRVLAASHFVRMIEIVSERDTPIQEKYHLLARALKWLCQNEPTLKGVLHFEKELVKILGLWTVEQATPPIKLIQDVFQHLPEQRTQLLDRLGN